MIAGWPLLILVALLGWGFAVAWVAKLVGGVEVRTLGEALAIGMASVLAVSGVLVAVGAFTSLLVTVGLAIGIACTLRELVWRVRHSHIPLTMRRSLDIAIGFALIATVFLVALWGTAHASWNHCDDDTAYLYLAKRLVLRGDLLDQMNFRRLTSLGGMSALQAVFLTRLPDSFLPFSDLFLGPLLILFALWRSHARRWAPWAVAATFVVLLSPANLGIVNTSPVLIPVGLAVAAFAVALQVRVQATTLRARMVLTCILGLLVGSAITLRPQFGLPLGLIALLVAGWPPLGLPTLQRLAGLGAGLILVLGGWAVASWRAVGTPLFPLASGNLDPSWPANGPPGGPPSVMAFIGQLAAPLIHPPWAVALLGSIGVSAAILTRPHIQAHYRYWGLRLHVTAAAASAVMVAILLFIWWNNGSPSWYPRLWAPVMLAAVLVPFLLLNRIGRERSMVTTLAAYATFGLVSVALAANPIHAGQTVLNVAHDTLVGQVSDALSADRYANVRTDYAEAAAMIPAGARVLAAVEVPSLLISPASDLSTLDQVGSTSPSPHLPYFRGTQAKLAWFRGHGYDYIIAMDPIASSCYIQQDQLQKRLGKYGLVYKAWAPYYFDWFAFLSDVSNPTVADSTRIGSIIVVRL